MAITNRSSENEFDMKVAYFDCASGISGDMTLGALIDAGAPLATIQTTLESLGLPQVRLQTAEVKKNGFRATQLTVEHPPEHAHRHLHHITDMIDASQMNPRQRDLAKQIFTKLGEAEAKVHGSTLRKVHFHEVGAVDSISDICGVAIALDLLNIERIHASPVPTGHGFIEIAHGRCSVPAPATAELLKGIPLAASSVEAELTTPTGAAILAALSSGFGPMPAMRVETIGYGSGQRNLEQQPNILRVMIGSADDSNTPNGLAANEQVVLLETNLDDTSGEMIGHCAGLLWEAGALDVFTTAIAMKKNRPGVQLSVLCATADVQKLEAILFLETTTLGVRRSLLGRNVLPRNQQIIETPYGNVSGVIAQLPDGQSRFSPEFESCRKAALEQKVSLAQVYDAARRAFAS